MVRRAVAPDEVEERADDLTAGEPAKPGQPGSNLLEAWDDLLVRALLQPKSYFHDWEVAQRDETTATLIRNFGRHLMRAVINLEDASVRVYRGFEPHGNKDPIVTSQNALQILPWFSVAPKNSSAGAETGAERSLVIRGAVALRVQGELTIFDYAADYDAQGLLRGLNVNGEIGDANLDLYLFDDERSSVDDVNPEFKLHWYPAGGEARKGSVEIRKKVDSRAAGMGATTESLVQFHVPGKVKPSAILALVLDGIASVVPAMQD